MSDTQGLNALEWYFLGCAESEIPLCLYYEYARSSPTMVRAFKNVHEAIRDRTAIRAVPRDVAMLASGFPLKPWLAIPQRERAEIAKTIALGSPPPDLVHDPELEWYMMCGLEDIPFPEYGPQIYPFGDVTFAAIQVHWELNNAELKEAFQLFLTKYRPKSTRPKQGRAKSEIDYLNALGARRLLNHVQGKGKHVAKLAFEEMKSQVKASGGKMRMLYASPSALSKAAESAEGYLLDLYKIPTDRRLEENQRMSDEAIECFGPSIPWEPGIYLDDPPGFGQD